MGESFTSLFSLYSSFLTNYKSDDWHTTQAVAWLEEDKIAFRRADEDSNGHLDKDEFKKFVRTLYEMTDDEVDKTFKAWNVDGDGGIGKFEFSSLLATYHSDFELSKQEEGFDIAANTLADVFPCGLMCAGIGAYTGLGLCCCTCGLSCIPFACCCFKSPPDPNQPGEAEKARAREEKILKDAEAKALKTSKEKLIKGAPGKVSEAVRKSQGAAGS
jgi:hypothetical protein